MSGAVTRISQKGPSHCPPRTRRTNPALFLLLLLTLPLLKFTFHALFGLLAYGDADQTTEPITGTLLLNPRSHAVARDQTDHATIEDGGAGAQ